MPCMKSPLVVALLQSSLWDVSVWGSLCDGNIEIPTRYHLTHLPHCKTYSWSPVERMLSFVTPEQVIKGSAWGALVTGECFHHFIHHCQVQEFVASNSSHTKNQGLKIISKIMLALFIRNSVQFGHCRMLNYLPCPRTCLHSIKRGCGRNFTYKKSSAQLFNTASPVLGLMFFSISRIPSEWIVFVLRETVELI